MDVTFGNGFTRQEQAELEAVLQRIETDEAPGCWREQPDTIHVRGRLTEGRSGCAVLDVVVRTGPHEAPMVAKIGPLHDLRDEWKAFKDHLRDASALFAPIRAVTPAVLEMPPTADGEREAVVYDHAARFAGLPDRPPVTLEGFVRQAIGDGGPALERAEQALGALFTGIQNDLYAKLEIEDRELSSLDAWNLRLGIAVEIEIDDFDSASSTFELAGSTGKPTRLYPRTLLEAAARHNGDVEPGAWIEVRDLNAEWWGDRLMGQLSQYPLRLELVLRPLSSFRVSVQPRAFLEDLMLP